MQCGIPKGLEGDSLQLEWQGIWQKKMMDDAKHHAETV